MQGIAQFFVLFAGPIGLLLLATFVIARWLIQSRRRREREALRLKVIPGAANAEQPPEAPEPSERPALRVVAPGRPGTRREGP